MVNENTILAIYFNLTLILTIQTENTGPVTDLFEMVFLMEVKIE
mgnify:CR=1 FL=1